MKHGKRTAIAFIVGKIMVEQAATSVHDYQASAYFNFSGEVNPLNIYDYARGNYLTGTLESIYDYASGHYINVKQENGAFSGYDYETGTYFSITIAEGNISFYDYEDSTYYSFTVHQ
jgi:hypothetical protein